MKYGDRLEKAVAKYTLDIEQMFGAKIGKIVIEPTSVRAVFAEQIDYCNAFSVRFSLSHVAELIKRSTLALATTGFNGEVSKIMFNNSYIWDALPQNTVDFIGAHELAHLAHARLVGHERFNRVCEESPSDVEKIADIAAHDIIGRREGLGAFCTVLFSFELGAANRYRRRINVPFRDYVLGL